MKAHKGSSEPLVLLNVHFSSLDVLTPTIVTFFSPAAFLACAIALSTPSVTKVNRNLAFCFG